VLGLYKPYKNPESDKRKRQRGLKDEMVIANSTRTAP